MNVIQDESFDRWIETYGDFYESLPSRISEPCPRCGARELRLVFVGDADERIGYAAFWCDRCRHGLHLSRVHIPEGEEVHPFGVPEERLREVIPDFTVITPLPDDGKGEFVQF